MRPDRRVVASHHQRGPELTRQSDDGNHPIAIANHWFTSQVQPLEILDRQFCGPATRDTLEPIPFPQLDRDLRRTNGGGDFLGDLARPRTHVVESVGGRLG